MYNSTACYFNVSLIDKTDEARHVHVVESAECPRVLELVFNLMPGVIHAEVRSAAQRGKNCTRWDWYNYRPTGEEGRKEGRLARDE